MGSVGYGGLKRAARLVGTAALACRRVMVGGRLVNGATDGGNPAAYHGTPRPRARPAHCVVPGSPASTPSSCPRPRPPCSGGRLPYSAGDSLTPFAARVPGGEELHQIGTLVEDGVRGPPSKPLSSRPGVSELAADEKVC